MEGLGEFILHNARRDAEEIVVTIEKHAAGDNQPWIARFKQGKRHSTVVRHHEMVSFKLQSSVKTTVLLSWKKVINMFLRSLGCS